MLTSGNLKSMSPYIQTLPVELVTGVESTTRKDICLREVIGKYKFCLAFENCPWGIHYSKGTQICGCACNSSSHGSANYSKILTQELFWMFEISSPQKHWLKDWLSCIKMTQHTMNTLRGKERFGVNSRAVWHSIASCAPSCIKKNIGSRLFRTSGHSGGSRTSVRLRSSSLRESLMRSFEIIGVCFGYERKIMALKGRVTGNEVRKDPS